MASRTQMRLAQLTGSFGLLPGQISDQRPEQQGVASASALLMSSGSLLGPLTEMASAIRRIHGADQFAKSAPGQFHVDINPIVDNTKDLGSSARKFAELHLGTSINLKGVAITSIKDEDDMTSNLADALATQQSIKAYVDASVTAQDLDGVGDSGTFAVDLDSQNLSILGGTGLTSAGDGAQRLTISLDNTAVTPASYGSAAKVTQFTVDQQGRLTAAASSVDIAIAHTQVTDFDAGVRTNKVHELAVPTASFPMNSQKITGLLDPADAQDAATKAYVDAEITDNNLGFQGDEGAGSLEIDLDAEKLSIIGTANEIETAGSGNQVQIGLPNDVTIGRDLVVTGDLTVNGAQFKIDGETVVMDDTLMEMGTVSKAAPTATTTKDLGLLLHRHDGTSARLQFMGWDESEDKFIMRSGVAETNGVISNLGAAASLEVGALESLGQVIGGNVDLNGELDVSGITRLAATGVQTLVRGTLAVDENAELRGDATVTGNSILNGHVTLGNSASDVITFSGKVANSAIIPVNHNQLDLGSAANRLKDGYFQGELKVNQLNAVGLSAPLDCANQDMINVDINSGAIDGAIIGAASAAAGTFTALACDAKALAAAALNINSEASIVLDVADEFAVSDAGSGHAIKKTTLGAIQTFLASGGTLKHADTVNTGTGVAAGQNVGTTISGFGNGSTATREVYVNGQLMWEGAGSGFDFAASGANVVFQFDLEDEDVLQFIKRA